MKDGNSLSKNELKKFSNNIIKFLNNILWKNWEKKNQLSQSNTLWWITNQLKNYSWANSIVNGEITFNIEWEDKFESDLRKLWIIWSSFEFQHNKFRDITKWKV
jgi:hypothetical protein